jgi:hypothetical protein
MFLLPVLVVKRLKRVPRSALLQRRILQAPWSFMHLFVLHGAFNRKNMLRPTDCRRASGPLKAAKSIDR